MILSHTLPPLTDGVRTSSEIEWAYVVDAEATPATFNMEKWPEESADKLPDRSRCRQRCALTDTMEAAESRNHALVEAKQPPLVDEEIIAAILYTGPV